MAKGEMMEELIRTYFNNSGYFVVRGANFWYENNTITDVDLFLYGRSSSITRERINVDVKNKKSPQAFERILWANGLKKLLNFDKCIVATTDRRPVVHKFGQLHDTIILDGEFLSKLKPKSSESRFSEDELMLRFARHRSYNVFENKNWRNIYEESKARLLSEMDFSGFNSALLILKYFFEKTLSDPHKREDATRMIYIITGHMLITIDYILKDVAFLKTEERENKLSDGFKFGNLGKEGIEKIISIAVQISENNSPYNYLNSLEGTHINILKEFFSKNENTRNLFTWAREFERIAFSISFITPEDLPPQLKGILAMLLDYLDIERKKYFSVFPVSSEGPSLFDLPQTKDKS